MKASDAGRSGSFFAEFIRVLRWRPGQALGALYWYLTRRRVRARNWLRRDADKAPYAYDHWLETVERAGETLRSAPALIAQWQYRPQISIVLPCRSTEYLRATVSSIEGQCYPHWEMLLPWPSGEEVPSWLDHPNLRILRIDGPNAAQAITRATSSAAGDFMLILPPGTTLPPTALFHYVEHLQEVAQASIVFGDHDHIDASGKRSDPWLKPEWNGEMILNQDYVTQACIVRTTDARAIAPIENDLAEAAAYTQLIRVAALPEARVEHVACITAHLASLECAYGDLDGRVAAVTRHLTPSGALVSSNRHNLVRVEWPLPIPLPLVSIIIPTRDRVGLLHTCVESLRRLTDWPSYEILVVDNNSIESDTLSYFDQIRSNPNIRIFSYAGPFNYSAINNFAVSHALGSFLCFLNNDTEIVSSNWLTAMMRQAVRAEVGAVGAKLWYEDGSIQHAGVVIGMGGAAGHAHRFQEPGDRGYFHQVEVTRFASAVTAACMVVEKEKFLDVGGFDEKNLQVAYNDVDLCLKLQERGWKNVYEPAAALTHYESKSRGNDLSPEHLDRYLKELAVLQTRWGTDKTIDPTHHPRLDRAQETYVLRF